MRIDLPSGEWVEVAEKFKGSLAGKVQGAVSLEGKDGKVYLPGDTKVRQTDAFLKEAITDWSLAAQGIPIPRTPGPNGDRTGVIANELDLDDYTFLQDAVQPLVLKAVGRPNPPSAPALSPS